jgi:polyribonucleotide nucleotidyltransferase
MTKEFKLKIGNRELVVEIKNLAEQANGSCLIRYGDTKVLATAVMSKEEKEERGFFPLTVNYEEKYYAAGKIRGARYIRRESRPTDEAVCNTRLIDRAIRPLFPKNLKREVQVITTVLSWDGQNEPDILALQAASLALLISDIPWGGPVGAIRVGNFNNQLILNPTYEEREKSPMDFVLAGISRKGRVSINMMEGCFEEIKEELVLKALEFGNPHLKELIDFQLEIAKKIGKEKLILKVPTIDRELKEEVKEFLGKNLEKILFQSPKQGQMEGINKLKDEMIYHIEEGNLGTEKIIQAKNLFEKEVDRLIHQKAIKEGLRFDGRKLDEIRKIHSEAGLLPRTHGSGLFCRGKTKSLSILTLGAPGDVQLLEGMEIVGKKRFMHHYNFPPYSTGDIKPIRGPGRREIGHGVLAEKALLPLIPPSEEFPYTIRIVSEILSSNGSSSMASICSSSLALMDAGVPIKTAVAGIALGLMIDDSNNYRILTDIQGPEDHHGDMDLKIAGTKEGITAIQMDVKINGISGEILKEVLQKGREARLAILNEISKVLKKSRPELSPHAPRILIIQINPDKIRKVIGPGGKVINEIIEECGVSIDIEETGRILITAEKEEAAKKAIAWVKNITREVKAGETFQGRVKRILDFGAFIEILPGQEGLLHISKLAPHRVKRVEDVLKIGDIVPVKVISIDEQGRIDLALKEGKKTYGRGTKR